MADSGAPTGKWASLPKQLASDDSAAAAGEPPKLIVRRPGVPEVEIPIDKQEFTIGRQANEVDLALDDELVSRLHATLTIDPRGYFTLLDNNSKNGIRFANRTVRRLNLVDGDLFSIGKADFLFRARMPRLAPAETEKKAPPRIASEFREVQVPVPRAEDPAEAKRDESKVGWQPPEPKKGQGKAKKGGSGKPDDGSGQGGA